MVDVDALGAAAAAAAVTDDAIHIAAATAADVVTFDTAIMAAVVDVHIYERLGGCEYKQCY